MSWFASLPAVLTAVLVLVVPGLVLGRALGFRAFAVAALSPVLSIALVSVAGLLAPFLKVPWSLLPVAGLTAVAVLAAVGLRHVLPERWRGLQTERRIDPRFWWALGGAGLGGIIICARMVEVIGSPEHISQTFDNIFHLNAIRFIEDTGQASSLTLGAMTGGSFYPAGWHAFISLIAETSMASVPVAVNAGNIAIASIAWPLGCVYLCQQALGQRRDAAFIAGILSAGFGAFPLLMIHFGVLYPNLLSLSLLPALLAVGVQALGLSAVPELRGPLPLVVLGLASAGVAQAHPSTFLAFLAFLAPAVLYVYVVSVLKWRRDWAANKRRGVAWSAALLVGGAAALGLWVFARPSFAAAFWPPVQSIPRALLQVAGNAPLGTSPAVAISLLTVVGVVLAARKRRNWWLIGVLLIAALLFVAVSSFPAGRLRYLLSGTWYSDSYRLAALLPVAVIVPAAVGATAAWTWLRSRLAVAGAGAAGVGDAGPSRSPLLSRKPVKATVSAAGAVVLVVLTQLGSVPDMVSLARGSYALTAESPLLTSDEAAVLAELDQYVPADAVIASNPGNGSALAYALAGRRTMQLHILTSNESPDDKTILARLRNAKTDPDVCPAVSRLGIGYVLDFGTQEINNEHHPAPGLADLEKAGVAKVVDQHGEAKLLKLTACR
jgi:hypothetical protein